ncbi:MAG: hypothetical protein GXP25_05240 [Planctomycetes bacterium]|nr:hypothetical protein [Planctomycetota bacterium]
MRKTRTPLVFMLCAALSGAGLRAQEPRILMPRTYTDPGGWFTIRAPNAWEETHLASLGRRCVRFAPAADSEDAGKMDMRITFLMGWTERTVTDEVLKTLSAEAIDRLREECRARGSTIAVRETKDIILVRQSAIRNVIDEAEKDGGFAVIRMFVLPTAIHSYVIEYRLPKEMDEMLSVQFNRMVRSFRVLTPALEPVSLDKLQEVACPAMKVTVKCPPTWERKEITGGDEGRVTLVSPKARGGLKDPCPGVVVEKIPKADLRFKGETLTPEQIIMRYRDLYVEGLKKTYDEVNLQPKSALARIGREAALAFKLELASAKQTRYALLVIGIEKGTVVQVFLTAPAETFHHYAPLFGRMLVTMQAL